MNTFNKEINIGILDDHPTFRTGIKTVLEKKPTFNVCFEGTNAFELYRYLEFKKLDILILDINLPTINGYDILRAIQRKYDKIHVLMLSSYEDRISIKRALKLGAKGFISKNSAHSEIILAVDQLYQGKEYISSSIEEYVTHEDSAPVLNEISEKEEYVLRLICKEKSSQEIADILGLSINTINNHRKSLLKKVNTDNIVGLIKFAYLHGYMD